MGLSPDDVRLWLAAFGANPAIVLGAVLIARELRRAVEVAGAVGTGLGAVARALNDLAHQLHLQRLK